MRAQSTLCNPRDCSPPGSSAFGIFQARILDWVAVSSFRGSFWPRDLIHVFWIGKRILYHWATWEAQDNLNTRFSSVQFSSVQSLSHVRLFATPWITACQASLSIIISQSSLRLTSIESVMPSRHLILCRSLLLLPPIPPSIKVFSNESTFLMRWPKYWSFSFSMIPSKEIPGLISFRMDWFDLLVVNGFLISLSLICPSSFFLKLHRQIFWECVLCI